MVPNLTLLFTAGGFSACPAFFKNLALEEIFLTLRDVLLECGGCRHDGEEDDGADDEDDDHDEDDAIDTLDDDEVAVLIAIIRRLES